MNLNQLAKKIAKMEGKKKEVDIAQIKEIIKCLRKLIQRRPLSTLTALVKE